MPGMEKALHQYTLEPSEKPFDMKSIPLATAPVFEQKAGNGNTILSGFLHESNFTPVKYYAVSVFSQRLLFFV